MDWEMGGPDSRMDKWVNGYIKWRVAGWTDG